MERTYFLALVLKTAFYLAAPRPNTGGYEYPGGSGGHVYPGGSGGHVYPGGSGGYEYPGGSGGHVYPGGSGGHVYPGGSGGHVYGGHVYPGGSGGYGSFGSDGSHAGFHGRPEQSQDSGPHYKAFVGGLPTDTTDADLKNQFGPYGATKVEVILDKITGRIRGFGFVEFGSAVELDRFVLAQHEIRGKKVEVKKASRQSPKVGEASDKGPPKAFIGGLRDDLTEADIRNGIAAWSEVDDIFPQPGSLKVELIYDGETNKRKGFGFIEFASMEDLEKAVYVAQSSPDGKMNISGVRVELKKAQSAPRVNDRRGSWGDRG